MDKDEKIEKLYEAQTKLEEAIELLEEAVGDDANTKAYLIDKLKIYANNNHGFLTGSPNIDEVIEYLSDTEDEIDDQQLTTCHNCKREVHREDMVEGGCVACQR